MSWSALSVSGHPVSQIRTRTPRSIHTGPPSGECTGTGDDTKRFTCGEKGGKCDGEYFRLKLQLSTMVRSLLCAVAALAVERRSVTRIRGKCSNVPPVEFWSSDGLTGSYSGPEVSFWEVASSRSTCLCSRIALPPNRHPSLRIGSFSAYPLAASSQYQRVPVR